jgi:hypothetical protein
VKLLVILRNPVDRAYSHYNDLVTYQKEKRSFEEVVESHISKLKENEGLTQNFNFRNPNIISTGFYVNQLELWMNYFPKQQFLILKTEDFKNDPQKVLDKIFEFLNLPSYKIPKIMKHNVGTYKKSTMEPTIRSKLLEYFFPYNEQLSKLLGVEVDWKK